MTATVIISALKRDKMKALVVVEVEDWKYVEYAFIFIPFMVVRMYIHTVLKCKRVYS